MKRTIYIISGIFLLACGLSVLLSFAMKDSELTLMMRDMEKDMLTVRKKISKGSKNLGIGDYSEIYTAVSSKGEIDSTLFNAYSQGFLNSVDALETAANEERPKVFNAMIDNCMACHSSFCPGPKVRIRKLYLK